MENNSFLLFHRDDKFKKAVSEYYKTSHFNTNDDNNLLKKVFFSSKNIELVNKRLRKNIYLLSNKKYLIPNQDVKLLVTVMNFVFTTYAKFLPNKIPEQINELNDIVLKTIIPDVLENIKSDLIYLKDIELPLQPPPLPESVVKLNRTLPSIDFSLN